MTDSASDRDVTSRETATGLHFAPLRYCVETDPRTPWQSNVYVELLTYLYKTTEEEAEQATLRFDWLSAY